MQYLNPDSSCRELSRSTSLSSRDEYGDTTRTTIGVRDAWANALRVKGCVDLNSRRLTMTQLRSPGKTDSTITLKRVEWPFKTREITYPQKLSLVNYL